MSEYLSIKDYARKHKISIFQAVKLSKSGKVDTITKIVDGKEKVFIKDSQVKKEEKPKEEELSLESLKKEIEKLKRELKECCNKQ